ncbi:MAG TPA: diguanylate cyclase [Solirubrobacteraceae bacterium]|jgi:diguanylate cyclase (GGDEF)-like protein|nr:diguanylate cyclase [Solirubrobacteraceae bacterium]
MRTPIRHRRLLTIAFTAMWLLVAFHGAHALLGFGGAGTEAVAKNWVYSAAEVLAVAICAARAWARREDRGAWALIAFGLLTWTAGDLVWTLWLNNLANPPFPSIADPLYLAMYPAMFAALMLLIRSRRGRVSAEQWLDGGMVALAVASVGTGLILPTVLQISHGRLIEDTVNLAYPLGDVTLLVFVVVAFALSSWRPDRVWLCLGAAMMLDAVADLLFTYLEAKGTYVAGGILDTMWPAAMALFAVAAWQPSKRRATQPVASFQVIVLPLGFAALALGILVDAAFTHITPTAVALAAGSLIIGILRAVLTFMENIRMLRHSAEDALTDGLSGLGNRRRLMRDLNVAVADADEHHPQTLVFFDLNGFKRYNDTFGHAAGDALLARLGAALRAAVGDRGRAYRLGGDEFCLLLTGRFTTDDALIGAATAALTERGDRFSVSASRGVATIPDEAVTTTALLQLADQRMYAAKVRTSRSIPPRTHDVLMQVLSERAPDLHYHVYGVGQLVRDLGRDFGLDAEQLDELLRAAELHDVGKLGIPDAILDKPGPLNDDEWRLMRQHSAIGERILNADPVMQPVARLVRASHERWDGTGYPDGLAGTAIPLGARIIAVCDALDAMTSDRCYQSGRTLPDALAELRRCAGTQFDPDIVTALCARLDAAVPPAVPSAEGADDAAVLAHGLRPVLAGLAAEAAVHGHAEV